MQKRRKRITAREKLVEHLKVALKEATGCEAIKVLTYCTQGYWRRQECDCVRWSGNAVMTGGGCTSLQFHSYDTMTDCAKRGITIRQGVRYRWEYEVYAKEKK